MPPSLLVLGLLLGFRHALDPDHVVAVGAVTAREGSLRSAAGIGAMWGFGHTLTVVFVGGFIIAFRVAVPPRLGLAAEMMVGVMLIVLGIAAMRGRKQVADNAATTRTRAMGVGIVHGLAGSAAVAILVAAVVPNTSSALAYLALFGVGTVAGMVAMTMLIAAPGLYLTGRYPLLRLSMTKALGLASAAFGLLMIHDIGINQGLLAGSLDW